MRLNFVILKANYLDYFFYGLIFTQLFYKVVPSIILLSVFVLYCSFRFSFEHVLLAIALFLRSPIGEFFYLKYGVNISLILGGLAFLLLFISNKQLLLRKLRRVPLLLSMVLFLLLSTLYGGY